MKTLFIFFICIALLVKDIRRSMKKITWKKLEYNQILEGEGFRISYNPNTGAGNLPNLTMFANLLGGDVHDGEETALKDKKGRWLILEGDYRKEYEAAFPNYKKCLEVYKRNKANRSNWSTD